jgi:Na+/H+ antiporter NhaD/arsenite permease-like protein
MKKIQSKMKKAVILLSGGLEHVGFIDIISNLVKNITSDNILVLTIFSLWFCALVSGFIDNIPVARLLIPVIGNLTVGMNRTQILTAYSGLIYGIVWGDNLTPYGDTLIALQVAKENNAPFKMGEFFKIGFITAIFQLLLITIMYSLILEPLLGLILLLFLIGIGALLYLIRKRYFPNGFIDGMKQRLKHH